MISQEKHRILAVDFGEKRIGLALGGPDEVAIPLTTLRRRSDRQAVHAIRDIAREKEVGRLVVGEPRRLDGGVGDAARRTRAFAAKLERATGLPVTLVDEKLTSIAAEDRLREAGVEIRDDPGRIDQVAAQILLEEFLHR